jgi:quercetin dioxygenase-like cupin family protein
MDLPIVFYPTSGDLHNSIADQILPLPSKKSIYRLQDALLSQPQLSLEPEHLFAEGMYGRKLCIPAGSVVTGKTHRHEHFVLLTKGDATVVTDRGVERIIAPRMWVSPVGAKRALYTHSDCEFVTVHLNPENITDLEAIEAEVIMPDALLEHEQDTLYEFTDELQRIYA